ncbi:MAG: hypothetical protein ACE5GL_00830, partial [Calditrichia bacterium]
MPFQVDDFLIRREQNLPGVATILNPGLLLKRLHTELPEAGVAHLLPFYIRYKPGMNCIAGYRLVTSEKEVDIYAKAHGPDAAIKIRNAESPKVVPGPLGVGRIILKDIAVTLSFFPNDFKLSRLRRLNTPESRRRLLQRLGTNLDDSAEVLFKTLAYKPERRYVALVHPHG